jgi:tRNA pseudouridine55 synthase
MGKSYDGVILIDKERGRTSYDVVRQVKRLSGIKKVGHAGTLDPFATGLLIVMLGEGTKLSSYLMAGEKTYQATMRLGVETDTLDLTGETVKRSEVPELGLRLLRQVALEFVGEIEQVPPQFSAVSYQGRRAYSFAREGTRIDLQKRKVRIRSLEITSVDLPDVTICVACSSGTYIRSLAADLGRRLGPGAHLTSLRRLKSGTFDVKDALGLEKLAFLSNDSAFRGKVIPLSEALPEMLEIQVDDLMARKIRNGYQPLWNEVMRSNLPDFFEGYLKLTEREGFVAIGKASFSQGKGKTSFKIVRVFR